MGNSHTGVHHDHASCGGYNLRTRREILAGLGWATALGAAALVTGGRAIAQGKPHRIDVHRHFVPPEYLKAISAKLKPERPLELWSPARCIEDMDKSGVATSINSITTPGLWFGDKEEARRLARLCNEYAVKLAGEYPGRFGTFAAVPLPDVDGALKEIEYALDTLKVDGIGLFTSYGDKWLGDPAFNPVFEELNRRKAVVYTHPTTANCCRQLIADLPEPVIEYGTDTTRAIARMLYSGSAARFHDLRIIFSHAGGTAPFLMERLTRAPLVYPQLKPGVPNGVLPELQRFYYDVAQSAHPGALYALLKMVPVSHVVFGTDYPFRNSEDHVKGLTDYGFSAADLRAIERDNAVDLLPRWKV